MRHSIILYVIFITTTSGHLDLQTQSRSLYHCYPVISDQLDIRQAAWSSQSIESDQITFQSTIQPSPLTCHHTPELDHRIRNQSCILSPVVTSGPYYHLSGHPIRQNMAEWQDGLLFMMDIGVIDVDTCEPIPNALVDIWHANATGFYAGHPVPRPDLKDEKPQVGGKRSGLLTAYPKTVEGEHFLRAAWPTDRLGVSRFTSIFPGYYTGRATHVHAKIHLNWTEHSNSTFSSSEVQYIGQFFFPDEVNLQIDRMSPYNTNPKPDRTRNWRDSLNIFDDSHHNGFRPTFEIQKLGYVLNQGLVGFMTVGIDRKASYGHAWSP